MTQTTQYPFSSWVTRISIVVGKVERISLVPTWRDEDNLVRVYDPGFGKGKELLEELISINGKKGADLEIVGKEITIRGIGSRYLD
ncbi:MAG: hypothetical protein MI748_10985 [Opitutales bacterium]|nr:hypothetical protein [Opitutales bacterium]